MISSKFLRSRTKNMALVDQSTTANYCFSFSENEKIVEFARVSGSRKYFQRRKEQKTIDVPEQLRVELMQNEIGADVGDQYSR